MTMMRGLVWRITTVLALLELAGRLAGQPAITITTETTRYKRPRHPCAANSTRPTLPAAACATASLPVVGDSILRAAAAR